MFNIKEEVSKALNGKAEPEKMRLYKDDKTTLLPDVASIADHHDTIKDDSVLYLVFRKAGMEDAFI